MLWIGQEVHPFLFMYWLYWLKLSALVQFHNALTNKNAFQWDVYRPNVERILVGDPPEKLEIPRKIGDPPKNWRPPEKLEIPPEKLENPPKNWRPPEKLETPLWTEWMTDACENITLAKTSFRPVITMDFDYVSLLGMSCLLSILMVLLCSALDCNETSRTWNRPIAKPHSGVTQRRLFPFKKLRLTHLVYLLFLETRLQRTNISILVFVNRRVKIYFRKFRIIIVHIVLVIYNVSWLNISVS